MCCCPAHGDFVNKCTAVSKLCICPEGQAALRNEVNAIYLQEPEIRIVPFVPSRSAQPSHPPLKLHTVFAQPKQIAGIPDIHCKVDRHPLNSLLCFVAVMQQQDRYSEVWLLACARVIHFQKLFANCISYCVGCNIQ